MSNFLSKTYLNQLVNETLQKRIQEKGKEHILGSWIVGDARYHYCQENDTPTIITIYLPTITQGCLYTPASWKKEKSNDLLIDIRYYYKVTGAYSCYGLELLYSHYYAINPLYQRIFDETIYAHKELYGSYCPQLRVDMAYQKAQEAAAQHRDFEVARLYVAAALYAEGRPLDECFTPIDPVYKDCLTSIQAGYLKVNYEEYLGKMKEIRDKANPTTDPSIILLLQNDLMTLMKESFKYQESINNTLIKLTKNEQDALAAIKSQLKNNEGTVKISKLVEKTNISRPVYNNLLQKLKENNSAEIINNGSKGTTIKFY